MSYRLEMLPDEPIVLIPTPEDFKVGVDIPAATDEFYRFMENAEQDVYLIVDVTHYKVNVEDMLSGASMAARGGTALFHHPRIYKILIVTPQKLAAVSAKGMNSAPFGFPRVEPFPTMEEALAEARAHPPG